MLLLFLIWKHDDCFIPQLGQHLQSSKTPDLKPEDEDDGWMMDGWMDGWVGRSTCVRTGGCRMDGETRDGETRVVSAKCLMSLNDHLLRPGGTSPPGFSFTRFIVEQCLLKKTSI